jgi:glycosyl transferase family 87
VTIVKKKVTILLENTSAVIRKSQQTWLRCIVYAAATAFAIKIYIALTTYGTNDVLSWELFLAIKRLYGGMGLYYRVEQFNHPPFIIHLLSFLGLLQDAIPLPFPFWLRLPAIFADLAAVILVWKTLLVADLPKCDPLAVLLMALCPTSIMISGFHGNTDPLMIALLLLSIYLIEGNAPSWVAGVAMGLATNVKVVPVVFLPVILLYLPNSWARAKFLLGAAITFAITSLPYILEDPLFIFIRVFGYGSLYGQWGLSRIFNLLVPHLTPSLVLLQMAAGKILVVTAVVAASFWMNRRHGRPPLFAQVGFIMFIFMSLAPGFGIQYLAWLVPWVIGLGAGVTITYYLASGVFQFLVYTFWSGEFPWVFADSLAKGSWKGGLVVVEVVVWLVVVFITILYGGALKRYYESSYLSPAQKGGLRPSNRKVITEN